MNPEGGMGQKTQRPTFYHGTFRPLCLSICTLAGAYPVKVDLQQHGRVSTVLIDRSDTPMNNYRPSDPSNSRYYRLESQKSLGLAFAKHRVPST